VGSVVGWPGCAGPGSVVTGMVLGVGGSVAQLVLSRLSTLEVVAVLLSPHAPSSATAPATNGTNHFFDMRQRLGPHVTEVGAHWA
jgi:hypothetical protein